EGLSTHWMVEHVSESIDRVVGQVLAAYESARERWVQNRAAVLIMRVESVLAGDDVDPGVAEAALGYRLLQRHLAVVLWVERGAPAVARAAGPSHGQVTYLIDVAPVAMVCSEIESAREWVGETLGPLATDSERHERLRETARVFLQTGGSYTATADQLFVHRNTAQYRVQKAEELRGRPLREGRLAVELALP